VKLVFDTNVLISRLMLPRSIPGLAISHAVRNGQILASRASMAELADELIREKFDRYVPREDRERFLTQLAGLVLPIPIQQRIEACRDPHDDQFLELAVNGEADAILTGDDDLLALNPFRGIAILSPAEWLSGHSPQVQG
jgi:uncharacterized protein